MNWFSGSIPEAVAEAKRNNKLFLVYVEGTDEMSQKMTSTYNDQLVAKKLSAGNVVALKLAANSVPYIQFCAIYPVLVIPSSYFIGVNGAPIEIITGSLLPPEFSAKIDKVLEIHEKGSITKKENIPVSEASLSPSDSPAPSTSTSQQNTEIVATPSTSQVADSAEASPPLEDKVERAKVLLEEQKAKKALEEQEVEKSRELERRNVGKAIQQAQQTKQENELREWAKNRAKEKEEERLAREKVKAMIAQDRAERAARYQQLKQEEQAEKDRLVRLREEQEQAARNAAMNSNDARIQFRLPDGSSTNHSFSADSTLEEARQFVINVVRPPFSNFSLCTTFPRRHFTESNYPESLRDLQLAPSAVLLILPAQAVTRASSNGGFLSNLFWMLLSPLTTLWNLLVSLFPGSSQSSNSTPPEETPNNANETVPKTNQPENRNSQSVHRRGEPSFYKREGNVFRINNQSDDDDENNTWNGNSTQQM